VPTLPDLSDATVRRRWLRIGAIVIVGLIALRFGWRALVPPAVPTMAVTRGPLVQTVVATGRVRADARARLGAQLTGTVIRVLVREGDTVRVGQLLAELDPTEQVAAVGQARANLGQSRANLQQIREVRRPVAAATLRQAEAGLEKAEADYRRLVALRDGGAASEDQLESARQTLTTARSQRDIARAQATAAEAEGADIRLAEASVAAAQAALDAAEARLAYTRIVSPGTGIVLIRAVEPGDAVQPGRVLMELALKAPVMLSVVPDEKNLARLAVGQAAVASADAFPQERFPATVSYVSPVVDPAQGTVEVRLTVDSVPEYLRPDMTISVNIEVARRGEALVVPLDAVHEALSGAPWVLVIRGREAARQPVRLGAQGTESAEVLDGLAEGDRVVPVSARGVAEGDRVRAGRPD
jgi:HlyD family secretion protein